MTPKPRTVPISHLESEELFEKVQNAIKARTIYLEVQKMFEAYSPTPKYMIVALPYGSGFFFSGKTTVSRREFIDNISPIAMPETGAKYEVWNSTSGLLYRREIK